MPDCLRVGLLGLGVVGSGVVNMLRTNSQVITSKTQTKIDPLCALVQDPKKTRDCHLETTTNPDTIIDNPEIDVVVEVMGGMNPAEIYIRRALENGKYVVTANKELMARKAKALLDVAKENGVALLYEAAVCGGLPVIDTLNRQLSGNRFTRVMGIVNGTTNFILSEMHDYRESFEIALQKAKDKGYAEANPNADIENFDAQSKLSILGSLAFSFNMMPDAVFREGISNVQVRDIEFAEILGFRIKSVAIAQETPYGIEARVHPALIPLTNPLSKVDGANNAVLLDGDYVGEVMLFGLGAGSKPTASAVVSDLMEIALLRHWGQAWQPQTHFESDRKVLPMGETRTKYYIRITSEDRPKALGQIAMAFGDNNVSLSGLEMHELPEQRSELVFLTHTACEREFISAVDAIRNLPMIERVESWLRVEV